MLNPSLTMSVQTQSTTWYGSTYGTATAREPPTKAMLQNIIIHICTNAVVPRFEMRVRLIFVEMVGCDSLWSLLVSLNFLHF